MHIWHRTVVDIELHTENAADDELYRALDAALDRMAGEVEADSALAG